MSSIIQKRFLAPEAVGIVMVFPEERKRRAVLLTATLSIPAVLARSVFAKTQNCNCSHPAARPSSSE